MSFHGIALGGGRRLPLAFVVKRGVRAWTFHDDEPEKGDLIDYHACLDLTGHSRTMHGVEFWATTSERWVRLEDVTLVRSRTDLPSFAVDEQKWMDVSVVTGTLVAYEGRTPTFATLVSVGRDRLGAPDSDAVTTRGELEITGKHVTAVGRDPNAFVDGIAIYDAPWVLELSSGQPHGRSVLARSIRHRTRSGEHRTVTRGRGATLSVGRSGIARRLAAGITEKPRDKKPTIVDVRK